MNYIFNCAQIVKPSGSISSSLILLSLLYSSTAWLDISVLMEIVVLVLSFILFVMRSRICPTDQGEIEPSISPSSVDLKPASLLYQYLLYTEVEKT